MFAMKAVQYLCGLVTLLWVFGGPTLGSAGDLLQGAPTHRRRGFAARTSDTVGAT